MAIDLSNSAVLSSQGPIFPKFFQQTPIARKRWRLKFKLSPSLNYIENIQLVTPAAKCIAFNSLRPSDAYMRR